MLSRVSLVHIWEKRDSARLSPLPEITQLEAERDRGRIQTCLVEEVRWKGRQQRLCQMLPPEMSYNIQSMRSPS